MTLAASLLAAVVLQNPTYDGAWKAEQDARRAANEKIRGAASPRSKVLEGVREMEVVLGFTRRPEIEALEDPSHLQAFVLQRNDIYADLASGYARLGDVPNLVRSLRELRENLGLGSPATSAASLRLAAYYTRNAQGDEYVRRLLPNAQVAAELQALRLRDPELRFSSYPYATEESPTIDEADRIAGLSLLWSEAKYNFANFDLDRELDWNESYAAFLPRVRAAKGRYAYYNLLREFMALLQDGHTDVALPPKLARAMEVGAGLRTALVEGEVVVLDVSPALAGAGVSRGDVVETIDGLPAVAYGRDRWASRVSSSTPQDRDVRVFSYMLWRGPEGSTVRVRVRKPDGAVKAAALRRSATLALPAISPAEFRILPDGTAYLAFNTCESDAPVAAFVGNLDAIRRAGRLVIDVRLNGGGNGGVGYEILSHLVDRPVATSRWETPQYRAVARARGRAQEPYRGDPGSIEPAEDRFDGPVAVLTSARTFSAAEDFASACRTSARVVLVGEPTGGSTGQPLSVRLPGGGWARICAKRDRYPDGTDFVGKGVLPDVESRPTLESIRKGRDVPLERALQILSEKK